MKKEKPVIGLARGTVRLEEHNPEWKTLAAQTIGRLWGIFGDAVRDIQHIGSTSIAGIKAKPIIDVAVAVDDFAAVEALTPALEAAGFQRRNWPTDDQRLFAVGDYEHRHGLITHYIHVMKTGGDGWNDGLNFRDYLNAHPAAGREYEAIKVKLARARPIDPGREKYGAGKEAFIRQTIQEARAWAEAQGLREHVQWLDGHSVRLKRPFGLSFIQTYGRVFKVFDGQDSGHLCFGVERDGQRYFVKFAGAPTVDFKGDPAEAVARLRATVPTYRDLAHPSLINLLRAEETGGGFAALFEWTDAVCMGRQYPVDRARFMAMPLPAKLRVYGDILEFHAHVIEKGYVAVDFYDGSILYDFALGKALLCDIEFYAKRPYINQMGRMWGSTRFMSPEEFTLGAEIDERTNVYTMGATAFALFANGDRTPEAWPLAMELYEVAKKAVSDAREERWGSLGEMMGAWSY